jgi:hypothetical protein
MSVISLFNTVMLHCKVARKESHTLLMIASLAAYTAQLVYGLYLVLHRHDQSIVQVLCYVIISSFAVALVRAWTLIPGKHICDPRAPVSHDPLAENAQAGASS